MAARFPVISNSDGGALVTKPIGYDLMSNLPTVIQAEHAAIHKGWHFSVSGFATLASGAKQDFTLTTPNSDELIHLTFGIEGTTQTEFYMFEASSYDVASGGSAVVPVANRRDETYTSICSLRSGPSIVSTGTLLWSQSKGVAGSNPANARNVGLVNRDHEFVLKPGTQYLFTLLSKANDNIVCWDAEWYEYAPILI